MKKSYIYLISFVIIAVVVVTSAFNKTNSSSNDDYLKDNLKIKGLSFVAPSRPYSTDPMISIKNVNAEWIAIIPYGFIPGDGHAVQHGSERQWWGERKEGVIETILKAKENGLKVMLKPQIWIHDQWVGDFVLDNEENWLEWEESYSKYIIHYAEIAKEYDVDMICIGTEFKKAMVKRTDYWYKLIDQIKEHYDGPLTYSSNWDEYQDVPIWDKLDYIGISAYFPLTNSATPSQEELMKKWAPTIKNLNAFSKKFKKKIIFTEFGYLSIDGCAGKTWELENERDKHNANPEAQSIALDCLFKAFWEKDFWAGGFIWKWYPQIREDRQNFYLKDYSPQGKLAEKTLAEWYNKK